MGHLVENAVLSLSAIDKRGRIAGFCALWVFLCNPVTHRDMALRPLTLHGPTTQLNKSPEDAQKALKWARSESIALKHDPTTTLWLRIIASDGHCDVNLLRKAFASQPGIKTILAIGPEVVHHTSLVLSSIPIYFPLQRTRPFLFNTVNDESECS
eukprot:1194854-Prorocentrum_minimum.AAC.3